MIGEVVKTRVVRPCDTALDLVERIGFDAAIGPRELGVLGEHAAAAAPRLWAAYDEHWRRFCGARLDPQFWCLDQPARWTGAIRAPDGAPVVIVGTGPSLKTQLPRLKAVRAGVHLVTSPRGAEALADAGLVADLVLIEHQTALDAMFSVSDLVHRPMPATRRAAFVALAPHAPASLVAGVPGDRLFVPDPMPTWGLWPATAVALALGSGTRSVTLVGIDLGTRDRPDAAHAPLAVLLSLLAAHTDVPCVDAGIGGAVKPGWEQMVGDDFELEGAAEPLSLAARPWLPRSGRFDLAVECAARLEPLADAAAATLAAACRVRDGDLSAGARNNLDDRFEQLLAAGNTQEIREDVQDGLGAAFLPRYWRTAPDRALGSRIWRPAALAAHELVRQHQALVRRLSQQERTP